MFKLSSKLEIRSICSVQPKQGVNSAWRLAYLVISMLFVGGALSLSFAAASPTPSPLGTVQPAGFREAATTAATNSVWWVGGSSSDPSTLPNTGARFTVPVIAFTTATGCLSFWVAEGFANNYWGQVGYYICDGSTPVSFYQIWNLSPNTILAGGSPRQPPREPHLLYVPAERHDMGICSGRYGHGDIQHGREPTSFHLPCSGVF